MRGGGGSGGRGRREAIESSRSAGLTVGTKNIASERAGTSPATPKSEFKLAAALVVMLRTTHTLELAVLELPVVL